MRVTSCSWFCHSEVVSCAYFLWFLHKSSVLVPLCTVQINLATTSAAQLISRSQSVSSPSATTLTQSVLLGNTTSPPLNQSQAQMYLRVSLRHSHHCPRGIAHNLSSLAKSGSIYVFTFVVLGREPRASCVLGKCSAPGRYPQPESCFIWFWSSTCFKTSWTTPHVLCKLEKNAFR